MILFENEGKKLLADAGISVPVSQLITTNNEPKSVSSQASLITIQFPVVLKAQVLSGKRADAGGIVIVKSEEERAKSLKELLGKIINNEKVESVLIEEKVEIDQEFYVSISYDTQTRGPLITLSKEGGTGIEGRKVYHYSIDPTDIETSFAGWQHSEEIPKEVILKLINLFFAQDCLLLEINPLVKTKSGEWVALDAKVNLDDTAIGRHPEWKEYKPRSVAGYTPTKNEIEAKKIDEGDYRGTAGSTYFDFDGDIAILASGGGASITAMDALIAAGGKAANFTEYSGNPPREKVEKLTKIVLDKPGLNGLWIVGALANFTDIYETLSGIIDGLRQAQAKLSRKIDYPIVIRRAGPRDSEAFEMLKKVQGFDMHIFGEETSIPESAEIITRLAKEYANEISN